MLAGASPGGRMSDDLHYRSATEAIAQFKTRKLSPGEMYERLGPILEKFDVLICPTTALAAVAADHDSTVSGVQINGVDVDSMLGWVMTSANRPAL
jgi:amidase